MTCLSHGENTDVRRRPRPSDRAVVPHDGDITTDNRQAGGSIDTIVDCVSLCALPEGNTMVSAPLPFVQWPVAVVSLLAATVARTSVHVPPTLSLAASAGA